MCIPAINSMHVCTFYFDVHMCVCFSYTYICTHRCLCCTGLPPRAFQQWIPCTYVYYIAHMYIICASTYAHMYIIFAHMYIIFAHMYIILHICILYLQVHMHICILYSHAHMYIILASTYLYLLFMYIYIYTQVLASRRAHSSNKYYERWGAGVEYHFQEI